MFEIDKSNIVCVMMKVEQKICGWFVLQHMEKYLMVRYAFNVPNMRAEPFNRVNVQKGPLRALPVRS